MQIPGLSYLKDKWVLIGLAAGAGFFLLSQHHGYGGGGGGMDQGGGGQGGGHKKHKKKGGGGGGHGGGMGPGGYSQFPSYDRPGLYEVPATDFNHMRFSGQAELQRRLTVV